MTLTTDEERDVWCAPTRRRPCSDRCPDDALKVVELTRKIWVVAHPLCRVHGTILGSCEVFLRFAVNFVEVAQEPRGASRRCPV